ncbi:MAG: mechanosensitive ion channel family protein [Thermodesulfobacteriota bacterium]
MKNIGLYDFLSRFAASAQEWLLRRVLTEDTLLQALITGIAFLFALLLSSRIGKRLTASTTSSRFAPLIPVLKETVLPALWFLFQLAALSIAEETGLPDSLLAVMVNLLAAWIIIRITSSFLLNPGWARFIAVAAWTIAALNIMNLLKPAIALLDRFAFKLGGLRISMFTVLEGFFTLALLLWLARVIADLTEKRLQANDHLSPSVQVLFAKLAKIALVTLAILSALKIAGIDLTAFTIFTGAIGVGLGFGLQKILANLISGIILLLDKSIKPGDVVTVGNTYGWVNALGARFTSLVTRDGKEVLIPNEELIINKVENWSFTNPTIRLKIPVGIAYDSDVRHAMALCEEAARRTSRVLEVPPPFCVLAGFGDSAILLELRIWINDPVNGVANVKSEVMLGIWDRFHRHHIRFPFPQRDIHIRSTTGELAGPLPNIQERGPTQ